MAEMPKLKLIQCGSTSGHGSLIELWVPEQLTVEELTYIKELWALTIRQLERPLPPPMLDKILKRADSSPQSAAKEKM